ncbi:MAG: formylglycine-generating enzyme family protein [Ruminococcus sp.]|nr:formylglycine-generating enzyme family protein [Ruminococcus sp.]
MINVIIIGGRLYSDADLNHCKLTMKLPEGIAEYLIGDYEDDKTYLPLKRYFVSENGQNCLLRNGSYEMEFHGEKISVPLLGTLRKSVCKNELEQDYPFMDKVYPVIYSEDNLNDMTVLISETKKSAEISAIPKILRDGNREIFRNAGEMSYAYPVEIIKGNPYIIKDISDAGSLDSEVPLKHNDIMQIKYKDEVCLEFYWDQISKVWYEVPDTDDYSMIEVQGGRYVMGDYRGKLYNYSFGIHNVNMKKNWEKVTDPQYMNENKNGPESIGVDNLSEENSLAKNRESDFWCFNEDAVVLHDVEISDFYLGKYSVTMKEFYTFVNDLKSDNDGIYYISGDEKCYIHQIAAIGLSEKMQLPRDNGWGLGQRPAINVSFNEIAEYCNWLSMKNGFEPCYEIRKIHDSRYQEGLSKANVFRYEEDSVMQIRASRDEKIQFVEIICNRNKNGYRLPFEAEYEYVIRGGKNIPFIRDGKGELYAGIINDELKYNDDFSWQRRNTDNPKKNGDKSANLFNDNMGGNGYTSPVGTKLPNCLGFYDLSGGVWEIMNDIFNRVYFKKCAENGLTENPSGPQYSIGQLSDMQNVNADEYLKNRYTYLYEKNDDGTLKRVKATSMEASGKTHHVLRGGCYTNPLLFTSALHRHAAGGISYIENFINHFNARTGFRLARTK